MKDETIEVISLSVVFALVAVFCAMIVCHGVTTVRALDAKTEVPEYKITCVRMDNDICTEYEARRLITE